MSEEPFRNLPPKPAERRRAKTQNSDFCKNINEAERGPVDASFALVLDGESEEGQKLKGTLLARFPSLYKFNTSPFVSPEDLPRLRAVHIILFNSTADLAMQALSRAKEHVYVVKM